MRPTTRAQHEELFSLIQHEIKLAPDGARLLRVRRDVTRPKPPKPITRKGKTTRYVVLSGVPLYAHEIAHVLRVGPQGPLIAPGYWQPKDGDWTHVHPSNWSIDDRPRGAAARAAAARMRAQLARSGIDPDAALPGRPTVPLLLAERLTTYRDPRYWWARLSASLGDTVRELSTVWPYAHERAPRYWALAHHMADTARERLAAAEAPGLTGAERRAVVDAGLLAVTDERDRLLGDPRALLAMTARQVARRAAGRAFDSPEHAAAVHAGAATDAATDDLY